MISNEGRMQSAKHKQNGNKIQHLHAECLMLSTNAIVAISATQHAQGSKQNMNSHQIAIAKRFKSGGNSRNNSL